MSTGNSGWDFSDFTPPPAGDSRGSSPFGGGQDQSAAPFGGYGNQGESTPTFGAPAGGAPSPYGGQGGPFGAPQGGAPNAGLFTASGEPDRIDPFGTVNSSFGGSASEPVHAVKAPVGWLVAALVVALLAGIAASIFGGIPAVGIACWALAGPGVIGLLAVYLTKDVRARAFLTYSPPLWGPLLYGIVLVLAFVAVMIASLQIAFWVGRM
ncbi:hypothetical protein F8O01_03870 [Pseudoclavibacter chungangensis]|uniref:Uncharacterized protein n=1 Tax=Pseudoclavibacter chungangensis TaxID=587635 RepID=A0A7J5C036_9MICO|nr:hypothetical protein [Pseudoclavibacter chungangensis]KAB1660074.1 hypothetical protein F8O01_03870 [Pseudoclavibacter chungangensis]NYJ66825.1 hypothetical protein [Pseudoclavibacter chungangensis]